MHHYFEAITNISGDSLVGYFARVIDPATQNTVTMSADDNGTPIVTKSGVDNMGSTDDYGNLDFYVVPGTYHLDIYAPNATSFIFRVPSVAMNSSKGDPGPQGDPGPAGEGLAEVTAADGASKVGFQRTNTVPATTVDKKLRDLVHFSEFASVENDVVDASDGFDLGLSVLGTNGYERAKGFLMPGAIFRTVRTIKPTLAGGPLRIYSDGMATIFPDGPDNMWTIDIDYATGGTGNFIPFDLENISIADISGSVNVKNGIRAKRMLRSQWRKVNFNNLKDCMDIGGDSNLNEFDMLSFKNNVRGFYSTDGIFNNNKFTIPLLAYHSGVAMDFTGTGRNIIEGGDAEPYNSSVVIIADQLTMRDFRFERNVDNGTPGIRVLNGNRLNAECHSDGATQVLPLFDIWGEDNLCEAGGSGAQAAIFRTGSKRSTVDISQFEQLQNPGGSVVSSESYEPTNIIKVGTSLQAGGSMPLVEVVKDELIPSDLTLWDKSEGADCTITSLGNGGYRVAISGPAAKLKFTPPAGTYQAINIGVTATSNAAASQPVLTISGSTPAVFVLSNGWPKNHAGRKLVATMRDLVYTNPVFSIAPAAVAGGTTYDIYNLRTSQKYAPQ